MQYIKEYEGVWGEEGGGGGPKGKKGVALLWPFTLLPLTLCYFTDTDFLFYFRLSFLYVQHFH